MDSDGVANSIGRFGEFVELVFLAAWDRLIPFMAFIYTRSNKGKQRQTICI